MNSIKQNPNEKESLESPLSCNGSASPLQNGAVTTPNLSRSIPLPCLDDEPLCDMRSSTPMRSCRTKNGTQLGVTMSRRRKMKRFITRLDLATGVEKAPPSPGSFSLPKEEEKKEEGEEDDAATQQHTPSTPLSLPSSEEGKEENRKEEEEEETRKRRNPQKKRLRIFLKHAKKEGQLHLHQHLHPKARRSICFEGSDRSGFDLCQQQREGAGGGVLASCWLHHKEESKDQRAADSPSSSSSPDLSWCDSAARFGHERCLRAAFESGHRSNANTFVKAASFGNLECFKLLHLMQCEWDESVCLGCIDSDQTACLCYALKNGCPAGRDSMVLALSRGCVLAVEYLHCIRAIPFDKEETIRIAGEERGLGHVSTLCLVLGFGCEWEKEIFLAAAKKANRRVLSLLVHFRRSFSDSLTEAASLHGRFGALVFLVSIGCPWNEARCMELLKSYVASRGVGSGERQAVWSVCACMDRLMVFFFFKEEEEEEEEDWKTERVWHTLKEFDV
jgi:hypothetical protein